MPKKTVRDTDRQNAFSAQVAGVEPPTDYVRSQRGKAAKVANLHRRPKATFDLPPRVILALRSIAEKQDASVSDLAALALIDWLEDYQAGRVDLAPLKYKARSLKFTYKLQLPEEWQD